MLKISLGSTCTLEEVESAKKKLIKKGCVTFRLYLGEKSGGYGYTTIIDLVGYYKGN